MIQKDEIINWVIYKITSPSGRVYIGKTSNFKSRVGRYKGALCKKQKLLYSSLLKYGFLNHEIEIIERFTSLNSFANEREMYWIDLYKSNCCKYPKIRGLNLTDGGEGLTGNKPTDETKQKISLCLKGRPANNKGLKFTLLRMHNLIEHRTLSQGKPVLQYDSNGNFIKEYRTLREANRESKIPVTTIKNSINGKKSKSGFIFKYKIPAAFSKITFQRRIFNQQEIKTA